MNETRETMHSVVDAFRDGLRYLGDASYAILPADIAHSVGDLKKSILRNMRSLVDKEIEWVDERVAGGDRLREEWKSACSHKTAGEAAEQPLN